MTRIIVEGYEFEVPNNEAPMYNNLGWHYVIKEYLAWDYTASEIDVIIENDHDRMRVDNLESLIGE